MNILVEEVVSGCGGLDGRGSGSGDDCYGYSDGKGSGRGTGYGFSPDGTYFEHNSKYFGLHPVGEGYSGQQHLNVSYENTE